MKIALMGSAPSSINLLPFGNKEWKVWGCSPGALIHGDKAIVWFEIHRYEPGQPWFSEGYCNFLKNFNGPVYMAQKVPDIPNCVPLPVDALVKKYSPYWFNSTLSWMAALAIEEMERAEGPHKLGFWGVDMAANEEYYNQKLGCIYFAQLAASKGIEVGVPPESDLFVPPPLYGVCETNHAFIKTLQRSRELQERKCRNELQIAALQQDLHFINGAIDDNKYQMQTWNANMEQRGVKYTSVAMGQTPDNII
jgi:hypothetical protein